MLNRAKLLGLHPTQRDAIAWLLAETEIRDAGLPELGYVSRNRGSPFALWWTGNGRVLRAELLHGGGRWRCHLTLYRGNDVVADEWPRHPADMLRTMLGRVFPV